MLTAYLQGILTECADTEDLAATRERLKERFPRGATRRMTQLGMLIGSVLNPFEPREHDTLIYASEFGESQTLENYLDSFPSASPTLFQTSIHPSAVQQALIQRQQPVPSFFPLTGRNRLVAQALRVALLADTARVIVCGGEERGTWLLENQVASPRTFAFAFALGRTPENALARITLAPLSETGGELNLGTFFDALHRREALSLDDAAGPWLTLAWS